MVKLNAKELRKGRVKKNEVYIILDDYNNPSLSKAA